VVRGNSRLLLVGVRLDYVNPSACSHASFTATLRILTKLCIRCLKLVMLRNVYVLSFSDAHEALTQTHV
jgi:hypothetical protein